jgi:adenylylsulfate kinase-like enzyme
MMKKKKLNKNYGTLFWITGLSGSGKTTIAKKIYSRIKRDYGPTVIISGDEIRKIFSLKGYTYDDRLKIVKKYCLLAKHITNNKVNIIISVIGMIDVLRSWNRKNIKNYIEIYIDSSIRYLKGRNKKKLYTNSKESVVGVNVKPEFPNKPDIKIYNNFKKDTKNLSDTLYKKIKEKFSY